MASEVEAIRRLGGTILVHDCNPIDEVTAARERTTAVWSGDVWKTVVALRRHRPDLSVVTADVAPTGMAIVTGLDPTSTVLFDRYDELGNVAGASLMDYFLPTAVETPVWETDHTTTPSPHHPIGAKGVGESPNVGGVSAFSNAVNDAFAHLGLVHTQMPHMPRLADRSRARFRPS